MHFSYVFVINCNGMNGSEFFCIKLAICIQWQWW